MIKLTIDTNILIGGIDGTESEKGIFNKLVNLHNNGIVNVAISNRLEQDKENDPRPEQKIRHLVAAKQFTEISSPFRIAVKQSHGFLVVKSIGECLEYIFSITIDSSRKNTTWDTAHLYGHLASNRDYFLTTENRILKKRPFLKRIRINVAHPMQFLHAFEEVKQLGVVDEAEFRKKLSALVDIKHPDTTDPNFRRHVNREIDRFLALEAAELEQIEFDKQARDPLTDIGQVVKTITKWLSKAGFDGEFALLIAKEEYPRMKQQYEAEGAIYGKDRIGLIRWIDELYKSNIGSEE